MSENNPAQLAEEGALSAQQMPASLAGRVLTTTYEQYVDERERLHYAEESGPAPQQILFNVHDTRERVAQAAQVLQESAASSGELLHYLGQATLLGASSVDLGSTPPTYKILAQEYMTPVSLHDPMIPSPVEAIVTTIENKEVAQTFAEAGRGSLTGMLLSGSTTWGEYFAPRGDRRWRPDRNEGERSDVDMIAVAKDIDAIGETIDAYIRKGLVDAAERQRFEAFEQLCAQSEVDIFSLRAYHKGGEQSVHFLTEAVMADVSNIETVRSSDQGSYRVNLLHDFRPNQPNNPGKNGKGYTIDDLKGMHQSHYMPTPKIVAEGGKTFGYISDAPVGSVILKSGESTYLLGLMDFFVAIKPDIILDTDGRIEGWVKTLQRNIAEIQQDVIPKQIPRQKRMPKHILRAVQGELMQS